jgi:hypothetical protein
MLFEVSIVIDQVRIISVLIQELSAICEITKA